eukprot:Hpha_TRINITY_DN19254_c0_g1::TRINITY_DN19254_c0_g1_i1::g.194204::m.194204
MRSLEPHDPFQACCDCWVPSSGPHRSGERIATEWATVLLHTLVVYTTLTVQSLAGAGSAAATNKGASTRRINKAAPGRGARAVRVEFRGMERNCNRLADNRPRAFYIPRLGAQ